YFIGNQISRFYPCGAQAPGGQGATGFQGVIRGIIGVSYLNVFPYALSDLGSGLDGLLVVYTFHFQADYVPSGFMEEFQDVLVLQRSSQYGNHGTLKYF